LLNSINDVAIYSNNKPKKKMVLVEAVCSPWLNIDFKPFKFKYKYYE
jgi:hypothetical protein